jgi:hypothetical protein
MPSKNNISQNKRYFQKQLDNWTNTITQNLTNLTEPQAVVLAMMNLGMIVAQSCALTAISVMLAISLKTKYCNVYQRIREWCYDAKDKKGTKKKGVKRTQLNVQDCFDPLRVKVKELPAPCLLFGKKVKKKRGLSLQTFLPLHLVPVGMVCERG